MRELQNRVDEHYENRKAIVRKSRRDFAIKNETRIRTYDFSRGVVTDHHSGKTASLKDILDKGMLDKLK